MQEEKKKYLFIQRKMWLRRHVTEVFQNSKDFYTGEKMTIN